MKLRHRANTNSLQPELRRAMAGTYVRTPSAEPRRNRDSSEMCCSQRIQFLSAKPRIAFNSSALLSPDRADARVARQLKRHWEGVQVISPLPRRVTSSVFEKTHRRAVCQTKCWSRAPNQETFCYRRVNELGATHVFGNSGNHRRNSFQLSEDWAMQN